MVVEIGFGVMVFKVGDCVFGCVNNVYVELVVVLVVVWVVILVIMDFVDVGVLLFVFLIGV